LTEELRLGPVSVTSLFERAAEQRISEKTLRRAQKNLGVMAKKSPKFQGEWIWEFPFDAGDWATIKANLDKSKMVIAAKGGLQNEQASLDVSGHLWAPENQKG
jgi:hypothetical protein